MCIIKLGKLQNHTKKKYIISRKNAQSNYLTKKIDYINLNYENFSKAMSL